MQIGWSTTIALLLLFLLAGCERRDRPPPAAESADTGRAEGEFDRLRAIPYISWTDEDAAGDSGVVLHRPDRAWPGYTLFSNRGVCSAVLIDMAGSVVHQWSGPVDGFWGDLELLRDGTLLQIGATDDDAAQQMTARYIRKLGWDSSVIWAGSFPAHHDVEVLPDGSILTLSGAFRRVKELGDQGEMIDESVVLLSPTGDILEEYSLYDLFASSPGVVALRPYRHAERRGPRIVVDAFHANSVEWIAGGDLARQNALYQKGRILVCVRNQDYIGIFDGRSGRFVWGWGREELIAPHCARILPSGNVIVFDNGLGRGYSRILEVDPRSNRIVWTYQKPDPEDFYSSAGGACQRLPNGNTLITNTRSGQIFEVTAEGDVVWDYLNPLTDERKRKRATIPAAKRLDPSFVDPILRRYGITPQ